MHARVAAGVGTRLRRLAESTDPHRITVTEMSSVPVELLRRTIAREHMCIGGDHRRHALGGFAAVA